jgi:hypothetical protein
LYIERHPAMRLCKEIRERVFEEGKHELSSQNSMCTVWSVIVKE